MTEPFKQLLIAVLRVVRLDCVLLDKYTLKAIKLEFVQAKSLNAAAWLTAVFSLVDAEGVTAAVVAAGAIELQPCHNNPIATKKIPQEEFLIYMGIYNNPHLCSPKTRLSG